MLWIQYLANGVAVGSLYALTAVGMALILWTTRVFHIAHGAAYTIAAYTFVALLDRSVVLAVVASVLTAGAFGFAVNKLVYEVIQRRRERAFFTLFVASFGVLIVVTNVVSLLAGSDVRTLPELAAPIRIGSIQLSVPALVGLVAALVLLPALRAVLVRTRLGVGLRAMADDPALVDLLGLRRRRYGAVAFVVGSVMVVPAAILTTYSQGVTPGSGLTMVTMAIIVSIAGGIGSMPGAVAGALILGVVENVATVVVSPTWSEAVGFTVLLALLIVRPNGLVPSTRASAH